MPSLFLNRYIVTSLDKNGDILTKTEITARKEAFEQAETLINQLKSENKAKQAETVRVFDRFARRNSTECWKFSEVAGESGKWIESQKKA